MSDQHKPTFRPHTEPHVDPVYPDEHEPQTPFREIARLFLGELDRILAFIIESENPRLAAYCLAFAMGRNDLTGCKTPADIARKCGVGQIMGADNDGVACVSGVIKKIQRRFGKNIAGIQPMPGQRTESACKTFSKTRKDKCT